jgi:hypothetical protein
MEAAAIIEAWKRRLVAMAEDPPYVFRDTPRELIAHHHRQLTTFTGDCEADINRVEQRLGLRFPSVFRAYLREMGQSRGDLFHGSDVAGIADLDRFRADALALMAETDPQLSLPGDAVVFLFQQGYTFVYLRGQGGFDGPVWQYLETEQQPQEITPGFADLVDAELRSMEHNRATTRTQGGY